MTKVLKYGIFAIALLFLCMILVPWLFKDEIFKKVKDEANKNLKGELAIEDLSLSLIRDFPNLTLTLDKVSYMGDSTFAGVELLNVELMRAELDLMSVIRGEIIEIKEIYLRNSSFDVRILEDGTANYLIMKEDSTEAESPEDTTATSPFHIALERFRLENMTLVYTDFESKMNVLLREVDMDLTGDFTQNLVKTATKATSSGFTFEYDGVKYFNETKLKLDVAADYEQESGKLTLSNNDIYLNNLQLLLAGWIQSFDEKIALQLDFSAPKGDFKEFMSLIPALYLEGYEDAKVSGKFSFAGDVKGDYFYEGDNLPAFNINLKLDQGKFQYPDLPSAVTDIVLDLQISHPQGETDLTVINLSKGNMKIANSPLAMHLLMKNPMTDPYIDFAIQTRLNLKNVLEVAPVEGMELTGILNADAAIKGRMSHFETEQYDLVEAKGWISAKNLKVFSVDFKTPVTVDTVYTAISPQTFSMPILQMKVGSSDFSGSANFSNVLSYVLSEDTLVGEMNLAAGLINTNELMNMMADDVQAAPTTSGGNVEDMPNPNSVSTEIPVVPVNLNLTINAKANTVKYTDMTFTNLAGQVLIHDAQIDLKDFVMDLLEGKIMLNGNYATPAGVPTVNADMEMKNIDAKTAFTTFNSVRTFAPIASTTNGSFGAKLNYSSDLNAALEPDLKTLSVKGVLTTAGLSIAPQIMQTVANILEDDKYKSLALSDANLSFQIENGRLELQPIKMKIADFPATFSGSQGLDKTMDYSLKTTLPLDKIKLPAQVAALGINTKSLPVNFLITGTYENPIVKPVFGTGASAKELISNIVTKVVTEAKDSAINTINREAEKIMADAQKRADQLLAEAQKQVDALKAERDKQAAALRAEAKKQADELVAAAKGNPIKETAAKIAADKIVKESNKQIAKLQESSNKQADEIMAKAKAESDKIMKEATEKAKIQK